MVLPIRATSLAASWGLFGLGNGVTWVAYHRLWMRPEYVEILAGLGTLTFVAASLTFYLSRNRRRALVLLVVGLVVGQRWIFEILLIRGAWMVT